MLGVPERSGWRAPKVRTALSAVRSRPYGGDVDQKEGRMKFEVVRTFPASRNKGFAFLRDVDGWDTWMPLSISENHERFRYTPFPGVVFTGAFSITEEAEHEMLAFGFDVTGLPHVEMKWTFDHAGPGAFTLRSVIETETETPADRLMEAVVLMSPVIRRTYGRSLDRLERLFLGELEVAEPESAPVA